MPKVFGPEHFIYLTIIIITLVPTFLLLKKYVKTEKQLSIVIKTIGIILLGLIVWNRISISIGRDNIKLLIPDSFCGTSSFVLSLSAIFLKRDHKILHCVAYVGLLGGMVTIIYPEFIDQADSIFYPMTISGLLHHTIMVFLIVFMLSTGYLKPSTKLWYVFPLGMSIYMTYGIFLITIIRLEDAMYINEPILSGTILNWFVLGILIISIQLLFLFTWETLNKNKVGFHDTINHSTKMVA